MQVKSEKIKIVCVGDSITEGCGSTDGNNYEKYLQETLCLNMPETKFEIINLGVGGRTASKTGDLPYVNEPYWDQALDSNADIFIFMLGTNDAKHFNWNQDSFCKDWLQMVRDLGNIPSQPTVFVMIPPPIYKDGVFDMKQDVINKIFPVVIRQLAFECFKFDQNQVIDLFSALGGEQLSKPELLVDFCHPNN